MDETPEQVLAEVDALLQGRALGLGPRRPWWFTDDVRADPATRDELQTFHQLLGRYLAATTP